MTDRAVVFDLWGTLVRWDLKAGEEVYTRMGALLGVDVETFYAAWIHEQDRRWTGPFVDGVRSVCACSGDAGEVWDATPLADCFETTVFSYDVGLAKPDPRVYETAAERLGVAPETCLYVDDRPSYVRGAQTVGMGGVLIDPPDGPDPHATGWEGRRVADPAGVLALV